MQIILLESIPGLGKLGDEVTVAPGFARNFLVPQEKAIKLTQANRSYFESRKKELEAREADHLSQAQKRGEQLGKVELRKKVRASAEGKLFGSVGVLEVVQLFADAGVDVAKREITLPAGTIRELGEYQVVVTCHSDVVVSIPVVIESDAVVHDDDDE